LMRIKVLPHSELDKRTLQELDVAFAQAFPGSRITYSNKPVISPHSLNPGRGQFNSTLILQFLHSSIEKSEDEKILVFEPVDLYANHLNFVFGEADSSTGFAVISTYRLIPELYGEDHRTKLFLNRLVKEAVHELGHTTGLDHCRKPTCVMYFSNSILDTDLKGQAFCQACKMKAVKGTDRSPSLLNSKQRKTSAENRSS